MKKTSMALVGLVALSSVSLVYAAKNDSGSQGTGQAVETPTVQAQQKRLYTPPSPTGIQEQNQNQVKTQNQGEEQKMQVKTQEQESQNDENMGQGKSKVEASRNADAQENMSIVAQKVEDLLTIQTPQGGIGEQVKRIAQDQKQSQEQIQMELEKFDNRKGLLKSLIGPDFAALKNMQKQMEQNQLRIQELEQTKLQLTSESDAAIVQAAIQAMIDQNTNLTDVVATEEQSRSMFGWLFRMFVR